MNEIVARRVKSYGPNFALYKVDPVEAQGVNTLEENGPRKVPLPRNWNGIFAVRETAFCGRAKSRTGAHRLDAENTEEIVVTLLRVTETGKVNAGKWVLVDQDKVDDEYFRAVRYNI